jgi:hemolysin D
LTRADGLCSAESSTSEPKGQELVYAARISLDRTQMQIDDNLVNLTVTVEIKTGSRSVTSYLLSPLVRYAHESLRERWRMLLGERILVDGKWCYVAPTL